MEYSVARKAVAIITLIPQMPWNPDHLKWCIFRLFTFRIFIDILSSMKTLCVLKRIWKPPLPMACASRLACMGTFPPRKQFLRKPLSLCKILLVNPRWTLIHHRQQYCTRHPYRSELASSIMIMFISNLSCRPWSCSSKLEGYTVNTYPFRFLRGQRVLI